MNRSEARQKEASCTDTEPWAEADMLNRIDQTQGLLHPQGQNQEVVTILLIMLVETKQEEQRTMEATIKGATMLRRET